MEIKSGYDSISLTTLNDDDDDDNDTNDDDDDDDGDKYVQHNEAINIVVTYDFVCLI